MFLVSFSNQNFIPPLIHQSKLNNLYVDQAPILIDKWSLQIKDATIQASKTHKDALPIKKWERHLELLKAQIYLMKMRLSK